MFAFMIPDAHNFLQFGDAFLPGAPWTFHKGRPVPEANLPRRGRESHRGIAFQ